jgi:hypothetical protein
MQPTILNLNLPNASCLYISELKFSLMKNNLHSKYFLKNQFDERKDFSNSGCILLAKVSFDGLKIIYQVDDGTMVELKGLFTLF